MKKSIVVQILLKNSEGKVLLVKDNHIFLMPGGKVKTNEVADQSIRTILSEVTGLQASMIKRVLFDEDEENIYLIYTGEYKSGELTNGNLEWLSPNELSNLKLSEPLRKLLALIGKWKGKLIFNYGLYIPEN